MRHLHALVLDKVKQSIGYSLQAMMLISLAYVLWWPLEPSDYATYYNISASFYLITEALRYWLKAFVV